MLRKGMILFFELIQVSIGKSEALSHVPSAEEWHKLYALAVKHAVAGVCFCGVQRLPKEQQSPKGLLLQWFALAEQIKQRNRLVNARACELQKLLEDDGLRACVLKGQGVARLYDFNDNVNLNLNVKDKLGAYRQSGDIDVWVDGERDDTIRHMKAHYKCGRAVIHHIDVEVFDDVPVEVHFVPSYAYSLPRYRAYRRFFNEYKNECFVPSGLGFCVPSLGFNVVYMLLHIFRHVFHEGIGLRQLMDYYFVLRNVNVNLNVKRNANANKAIREMGLLRFAAAVMYVEREVFGLQKEYMLCEPDEKAGQYLLDEIMRAGNFGQYDPRIRDAHSGGSMMLYIKNVKRISDMVRYYPSEVLWAPFWKIGHFVWRKVKGY